MLANENLVNWEYKFCLKWNEMTKRLTLELWEVGHAFILQIFILLIATKEHFDSIVDFSFNLTVEITKVKSNKESHRVGIKKVLEGSTDEHAGGPTGTYFVALTNDGTVVGTLLIRSEINPYLGGFVFFIHKVYIDAKYRKKGVLTKLYHSAQEEARKNPLFKAFRLMVQEFKNIFILKYICTRW